MFQLSPLPGQPHSGAVKQLTYDQVAGRKDKAARFVRNVLGDSDRADEIEDEDVDDYAERRKIEVLENPQRKAMTNKELQERVRELEEENQDLNERLDEIGDLVGSDDSDDDADSDDDSADDSDDDAGGGDGDDPEWDQDDEPGE